MNYNSQINFLDKTLIDDLCWEGKTLQVEESRQAWKISHHFTNPLIRDHKQGRD